MADASGIQVLVDAAEHAASVGDWPSAEERLRRVAAVQTEQLGPGHTDLAYTLNNLGVVCERTGKPDEAEQFYGRAYAIAAAALPLDDPLVVTSGQNFRELSASRGKPLDSTPSAPPPTPPIEPRVESERPSSTTVDVPFRSHSSTTGIAVIVGIAIAAFIGWYFWSGIRRVGRLCPVTARSWRPRHRRYRLLRWLLRQLRSRQTSPRAVRPCR